MGMVTTQINVKLHQTSCSDMCMTPWMIDLSTNKGVMVIGYPLKMCLDSWANRYYTFDASTSYISIFIESIIFRATELFYSAYITSVPFSAI